MTNGNLDNRRTINTLRSSAEPWHPDGNDSLKLEAAELWKEAHSFHLIFSRIWRSTNIS